MITLRTLDSLGRFARLVLVSLAFGAILAADWLTGADLALRALYVLPVGLAAWLLGRRLGIVSAVVAAAACIGFDVHAHLETTHRAFLYSDAVTRVLTYVGVAILLDRLRAAYLQLDALANSDSLTGIANVRAFRTLAEREVARARRLGSTFTLVHVDLDGFKQVNDTRGHAEGDRVLIEVARVLASARALDIAARLGGDEFALFLPDTARGEAETVLGRLRERLTAAMHAHAWRVTFSMGAATFIGAPESLDGALKIADALMYDVKRGTKDAVRFAEITSPLDQASTTAPARA